MPKSPSEGGLNIVELSVTCGGLPSIKRTCRQDNLQSYVSLVDMFGFIQAAFSPLGELPFPPPGGMGEVANLRLCSVSHTPLPYAHHWRAGLDLTKITGISF